MKDTDLVSPPSSDMITGILSPMNTLASVPSSVVVLGLAIVTAFPESSNIFKNAPTARERPWKTPVVGSVLIYTFPNPPYSPIS